jgi:PleD family two-component response regulator
MGVGFDMEAKKQHRVLIIDDAFTNREILKEILKDEAEVVEFDNGKDALDYLMDHFYDLDIVLLDLVMPEMNGFEVLEFMRRKHMTDYLPVIMISADDEERNMEYAFDLGAIDFIARPFSERIVLRRVLTTISLFEKQKELIRQIDVQFKPDDQKIDELTGLPYKQNFYNKVHSQLLSSGNMKLWMVAIDIDHFKLFNNFYGWEKGDQYLRLMGRYLSEFTRRHGGIAGYLGGDDFAVLCPNIQPGVAIDYATGYTTLADDWRSGGTTAGPRDYVLNTRTGKFHLPGCEEAKSLSRRNRKDCRCERGELLRAGRIPCGRCRP